MGKTELEFEQRVTAEQGAAFLEEIAKGLRSGALELRKQTSGVGTVPSKKVYIYLRDRADGSVGLVARFPNGTERAI